MKLPLKPIVDKMAAAGLRNAKGVLEFSAQTEAPRNLPAYFVVPLEESARPNAQDSVGVLDQRVLAGFSVFIVLGARLRGDDISEELSLEIGKVTNALLLWKHPEASGATTFGGGRLASADGSTVVWQVRFNSPYHLRKAS